MRTDGEAFGSKWSSSYESSTEAGVLWPSGLWRWLKSVNYATDDIPGPAIHVGDESRPESK
jgi:hypothetical protein